MVGNGINRKSMAYVGNIVTFIKYNIENHTSGVNIYNYVDKPDLTMSELVSQLEISLSKKLPSLGLPYWMGMLGAFGFDILSFLTKKKFAVSSIRVRKFCATTQFDAEKVHKSGFVAPYNLSEGLDRTLQYEFIKKHDNNRVLFESE
jgi:GlcNAc-P-P-Und epimerase